MKAILKAPEEWQISRTTRVEVPRSPVPAVARGECPRRESAAGACGRLPSNSRWQRMQPCQVSTARGMQSPHFSLAENQLRAEPESKRLRQRISPTGRSASSNGLLRQAD